jgi:UDP-N-acetylmuramate dehydrogenase
MAALAEREISAIGGVEIQKGASLRPYTGFKTGGTADYIATPGSLRAFLLVINALRRSGQKFYLMGNGTNIIAPEKPYNGWIVRTEKALDRIAFDGSSVYCGAGAPLSRLCLACSERGLSGLEFAYGIPGAIGGAVYMNAGAYGGEIRDVASSVDVLDGDGNILKLQNGDMEFGYRVSAAQKRGYIILGASFALSRGDRAGIWARMHELMRRRAEKQPLEYPSCGSTFKRPDGAYASKLIDDCGLRGRRVGGAAVSEKHCGFVVNMGGATSDDIFELISLVKETVKEKTGFLLEEEIQILG